MNNNPPDIVFTWGGINFTTNIRNRYNNELYYSIKFVLKNLPWCNNIYILVNRDVQIPLEILNLDKEKIKRINRSDLIENKKYSITENSFAVYSIVDKIPNLNERFILFDDDFMMLRPVPIEFFFIDNYPIVRASYNKQKIYKDDIDIPEDLKRPIYKYTKFSHRPKPCTKEIIKKFRQTYPNYNSFVESHVTRFHKLSEEMLMIYYQFALENNMIIQKPSRIDFFQILHRHSNNKIIFKLEFVLYKILLFLIPYKSFNINDDWSPDSKIYKRQMNVIKKFLDSLY